MMMIIIGGTLINIVIYCLYFDSENRGFLMTQYVLLRTVLLFFINSITIAVSCSSVSGWNYLLRF
jgi:hypothetical protein